MVESKPDRRRKARSIGWLAEIYFRDGREAAQTALEAVSPENLLRNCRVVRKGEQALRTNTEQRDRIRYQSFNPPLWGWPYSILRARFDPVEKEKFMHHGGEEILLPTQGSVAYHFFWSAGHAEPRTLSSLEPTRSTASSTWGRRIPRCMEVLVRTSVRLAASVHYWTCRNRGRHVVDRVQTLGHYSRFERLL